MPQFRWKYLFPDTTSPFHARKKKQQKENIEVVDEVKRLLHVFVGIMHDCPRCTNRLNEYFDGERMLSEAADILSHEKEQPL